MLKHIARKIFRLLINLIFSSDPGRVWQLKIDSHYQLVWISEYVGRMIALRMFERSETDFLKQSVQQGFVCVDVGANVGYFTHLFAERVGNIGHVVAVEPIKRNAKLIELNSIINLTDDYVTVINKAVSENLTGETRFSLRDDSASSSLAEDSNTPERDNPLNTSTVAIDVFCEPLDEIVKGLQLDRIDILKMDIEGYEYRALLGMTHIFGSKNLRPGLMMLELFSKHLECFNNSIDQIVQYLAEHHYSAKFINRHGKLEDFTTDHHDHIYNVIFVDNTASSLD